MRTLVMLFLVTGFCLAAEQGDDAAKKEIKLFQGKWEAIAGTNLDGTALTDAEAQLTMLEVEDDKFTMKTGSLTVKGRFTLDPSKKPKAIDIFFGDGAEPSIRGIYEIKDDVRKSCFAQPGKDRPDKIRKEKGFMTLEWRQVK